MKRSVISALSCLLAFGAMGQRATQKVTYNKSTFSLYAPVPGLEPTPATCGFIPEKPGYTLQSSAYGPGTYYTYAPGKVLSGKYPSILTQLQDWIFYDLKQVEAFASQQGIKRADAKKMQKLLKNTPLSFAGLSYQLSENEWISLMVYGAQEHVKSTPDSPNQQFVTGVSYLLKVPADADSVVDRLYRFWNDGVYIADHVNVSQANSKTKRSAPNSATQNYFSITDFLRSEKGFYSLTFEAGKIAPTYLWHSYRDVVAANLQKPDFSAMGEAGYRDRKAAFRYLMNVVKVGSDVYIEYMVNSMLLYDLPPGVSWEEEMESNLQMDKETKQQMQQLYKSNGKALEMLYEEIFR